MKKVFSLILALCMVLTLLPATVSAAEHTHNYVFGVCDICSLPEGLSYTVGSDGVTVTGYTGMLTNVTIPQKIEDIKVTAIGAAAFKNCDNLERVELPADLLTIGESAFEGCEKLAAATIPGKVTTIGKRAFYHCPLQRTLSIPDSVTTIGESAFEGCSLVVIISFANAPAAIGSRAFADCAKLDSVFFGYKIASLADNVFADNEKVPVISFKGDAPSFAPLTFYRVATRIVYPCNNATWSKSVLQPYGGSVKWVGDHEMKNGFCIYCGYQNPYHTGVHRLAGSDRYETAFMTADTLKEKLDLEQFPAAIVTSGENFADALAGSYLAYRKSAPILLTKSGNSNIGLSMDYIRENVAAGGTVYALGGSTIVSDKIFELEEEGYEVVRLAGSDRYETNLLILEAAGVTNGEDILVCTGLNFADSLSASAVKRPILLVKDGLNDSQKEFLAKMDESDLYIIGGVGAVNQVVETQLKTYGDVVRLSGSDRFATSVLVAETFIKFPFAPILAVLAYGYNFPDGLCGGPLAAAIDGPLLLTATGREAEAIEYCRKDVYNGYVLGGPSLIGETSVSTIFKPGY